MYSSSPSETPADLSAAVASHLATSNIRISSLDFDGQRLWVKRLESLSLRMRLQKGNPKTAFETERRALLHLVAKNAPVPALLHEGADFMVLSDCGTSLYKIFDGQLFSMDERLKIFAAAGKALADWHQAGLAHGRPAIKDMCWQDGCITFLDFERFDPGKCGAKHQSRDLLIFVHSLFAATGLTSPEADAAIDSYFKHDTLDLGRRAKRQATGLGWLDLLTKPLQWRKSSGAREFKAIPLTLTALKQR